MKRTLLAAAACIWAASAHAQSDTQTGQTSDNGPNVSPAAAQTDSINGRLATLKGEVDGLNESYLATKATVDKLAKVKISGYIQTQFRAATQYDDATDTTGTGAVSKKSSDRGTYRYPVGDFAGGKFDTRVPNLFQIRRGRVKVAYETELTTGVLQLDVIPFANVNLVDAVTTVTDSVWEDSARVWKKFTKTVGSSTKPALTSGGVSVKDAYLRFAEPWLKSIAIKAGIFDRPFGFEIGYSSSSRESPERSRMFQTLFPNERDLGVALEYSGADKLPLAARIPNLKVGAFTGNGINIETDSKRDIIGRLGASIPITPINMAVDLGVSGYAGALQMLNDTLMTVTTKKASDTVMTIERNASFKKFDFVNRRYYGGDMQLYLDIPVIGGLSLRGEYIQGQQPGQSDNVVSPKSNLTSSKPVYLRNFNGFYVMWVQNLWKYDQFVLKYDKFDPNTEVEGDKITSATELAYGTLGLGLIHNWDENIKLMAYYEIPRNETSKHLPTKDTFYRKDLADNVFTFRIQYKF